MGEDEEGCEESYYCKEGGIVETITRKDGKIIRWSGTVEDPTSVLDKFNQLTTTIQFAAKLDVGETEPHTMLVRVPYLSIIRVGVPGTPETIKLVRDCVNLCVREHCSNSWVPGREEYFTINDSEMWLLKEKL
jgi:hypothetical protein